MNADAFIQQNSGGFDGEGSVTLGAGTTAGNRLIVTMVASGTIGTPAGFTRDSDTSPVALVFSKATVDSETSWSFGAAGVAIEYDVFEVEGLDPTRPVVASYSGTPNTGLVTPSTYDTLLLGVHTAKGVVGSTTVIAFDPHSTLLELTDHGHASGGSVPPVSISTCHVFTQSTYPKFCSCDSPGSASEASAIVGYAAATAKPYPVVSWFWAFPPELVGVTGLSIGPTGDRYWESQVGTPTIDSDGLRLQSTAAAAGITGRAILTSGSTETAQAVRFRLNSLPAADLEIAARTQTATEGNTTLRYQAASGRLSLQIGTGTEQLSTMTITDGQWLHAEIRTTEGTSGYTADWRVDDGTGPIDQPQATNAAATGHPVTVTHRLGWTTAATADISYAYAVYSAAAGLHPLGRYAFALCGPDPAATPTVSGTASAFRRFTDNGTIDGSHNATLIRDALDDWPPVTGTAADGLAVVTAHATDYLEIPMGTYDPAGTASLRAVMVLAPMWAASAAAASIRILGWDGTDEATLYADADAAADNTAAASWICRMWQPTAGWDQTKLDAAAVRVGSDDATPDVGPYALGMMVCLQEVEVSPLFGEIGAPLRVEQDLDPISGGIQRLRAYTPADQSATLTYDLDEVEQTPVDVPADSNPLTVVLSAADTTVVSRITLTITEP